MLEEFEHQVGTNEPSSANDEDFGVLKVSSFITVESRCIIFWVGQVTVNGRYSMLVIQKSIRRIVFETT